MAEEKLIQINLQLPVSELAGITALVEQVRQLLTEGKQSTTATNELEHGTSFDESRFQELASPNTPAEGSPDISALRAAVENELKMESPEISVKQDLDAKGSETAVEKDVHAAAADVSVERDIDMNFPRVSVEDAIEAPSTAEFAVSDHISSFLPERQRDAEQLVAAGPAPLTAEAVSLAFRRDDRRYDNGFPLY